MTPTSHRTIFILYFFPVIFFVLLNIENFQKMVCSSGLALDMVPNRTFGGTTVPQFSLTCHITLLLNDATCSVLALKFKCFTLKI